jgi:exo-beta-1,3-glucanase (GH17 family)
MMTMAGPVYTKMMKPFLMLFCVTTLWLLSVEPVSAQAPPLPELIRQTRFIAYTPSGFSISAGKVSAAGKTGIRNDLILLRPFFDGLITYSATSGLEAIPQIAHELGYRAVILGIWDPLSEIEIQNVVRAVRQYPRLVAAVIVGNEGLYSQRYQRQDVQATMGRLKKEFPPLPLTTSEPFFLYFKTEYSQFFKGHDLLMPNIHPVFEKWFTPNNPAQGVDMVIEVVEKFRANFNRPLLVKETGMPGAASGNSSPKDGFRQQQQARFWADLLKRFPYSASQSLACFEAFDAPWKPMEMGRILPGDHSKEAFWGFFTHDSRKKLVLDRLQRLEK